MITKIKIVGIQNKTIQYMQICVCLCLRQTTKHSRKAFYFRPKIFQFKKFVNNMYSILTGTFGFQPNAMNPTTAKMLNFQSLETTCSIIYIITYIHNVVYVICLLLCITYKYMYVLFHTIAMFMSLFKILWKQKTIKLVKTESQKERKKNQRNLK